MTVPKLLHIRLRPAAEGQVRSGHPWVFEKSIQEQSRSGIAGEVAVIFDDKNRFLAAGLYDPHSPIRVRVLHCGKPQVIDPSMLAVRLLESLERRRELQDAGTNGVRLVHGENDGLPGLVIDRYASTLVLKLYTSSWLTWLPGLIQTLIAMTPSPERIVLRLSRNLQELLLNQPGHQDGHMLHGPTPSEPVRFRESSLWFEADVLRGQKTGFFLDQRENRQYVETLSAGRDVLNAFSFSGGFSLYAARGGARSVTDLDISAHALDGARRNFALNTENKTIASVHHETVQANTFEWLAQTNRQYDLIILDPPSMAKRETERERAIEAYQHLAALALKRLRPNGILVAASCSAHVTVDEFFDTVREAGLQDKRQMKELRTSQHPKDHPATFRQAAYLKCIVLQSMPTTRNS